MRELDQSVAYYRARAFAETTKCSYLSHLKSYINFCEQFEVPALPVSGRKACSYAAHLASRLAYSSVPKYLNVLRILHRECSLPSPLQHNWQLDTVLKGIKREKGAAAKRKLPITPDILLRLRSQLHLSEPRDMAFWATCMVAFFGFSGSPTCCPLGPRRG